MEDFGGRLRDVRKAKKMTLKQVSEKTKLSIGFLSQVEHSKSSLTLETLIKLSEALGVSPGVFFSEEKAVEQQNFFVNKQSSLKNDVMISDFMYRDLSGGFPNQSFYPTLVNLRPRNEGVRPLGHQGQEFIYVLDGTLTVIFENEEIQLNPGESIHMESEIPHNWVNRTNEIVTILYIRSN